ncbi:uncharacterized protein N7496_001009 [Penicillium cataractarum]|uniref:Uncharacterized protein n=1 Tax=Penicillium cataractarum TaxID=2100454 RepID=A0A9W9VV53_9EURO|nr:uncharacterized protein N7496_001009 [Penicillium cataractarum]KAJ5389941.1 hypothetical protein N7496_001009 [Penicillium cataractarum]
MSPSRATVWLVPILIAWLGLILIRRENDNPGEFILANNRSSLLLTSTPQTLLDIDDALVSESNPAREDGTFDYERCARLHNYLVAYGWMAHHEREVDDLQELLSRPSFFELEGYDLGVPMHRLNPEMVSFLQSIILPGDREGLFYWVDSMGVLPADLYFFDQENKLRNRERFVNLHVSWVDLGSHNIGLLFDQKRNRVAIPLVIENLDSISPVKDHLDMWFPLETMLTNWIHMLRIGKVTASPPEEEEYPPRVARLGSWVWQPYSPAQVDSAVDAMNRLSAAIEARMPSKSHLSVSRESPLLTDSELDAASVPENCFIRSVLSKVKTPRFKYIAPGLEVPHDAAAFAARQKFTGLTRHPESPTVIPPVLIFANQKRTINFNKEIRYLFFDPHDPIPYDDRDLIPVGLYSEFARRGESDLAEEGFRLLLPFEFRVELWDENSAKKSDGSLVPRGSVSELFQHGYFPFGGEWRAQRFERLLDRWRELVESGVWKVGKNGVKGGIDRFQEADYGYWKDYWIPPGW